MARLFGTDGVRGVVNESLTPELAYHLGRAAAAHFGREKTACIFNRPGYAHIRTYVRKCFSGRDQCYGRGRYFGRCDSNARDCLLN